MTTDLAKLGHVAVVTPDLDASLSFFCDVIGLDEVERRDGVVYLRAWGEFEHHSLSLREGPTGIDHIAWRANSADLVPVIAERLEGAGTKVAWIEADEEAGQGKAIRFTTPTDHPFEVYYDVSKPTAPDEIKPRLRSNQASANRHGLSPRFMDHVNLATTDPDAGQAWMRDQFGFKLRELVRGENDSIFGAWLAVTSQVHDLALIPDVTGLNGRINHFSFYFDTINEVLRACDILREKEIPIEMGPGMHGISRGFFTYLKDPGSGHRIELFSGGYHIFDPDWEPIEWTMDEVPSAGTWWGPYFSPGEDNTTFTVTTPTIVDGAVA